MSAATAAGVSLAAEQRQLLVEALAAFVPPLTVEQIALDPAPLNEPRAFSFQGAVLFTDISGFTRLTETLDHSGPAGVEQLSRLLNAYFTGLIGLIEAHGGLVLKFAGDALMAIWRGDEPLAEIAQRAAQCALLIQERMGKYRASDEVTLSMRAGLGAGEILHVVLGGLHDRWASLLAGEAAKSATTAIALGLPGEVMLSPRVVELLDRAADSEPRKGAHARLLSVDLITEQVTQYPRVAPAAEAALLSHISVAVRSHILAGHSGWLADFRRLSVLFINVPDLHTGEAKNLLPAQRVMQAIQRSIERFGGVVDNLGDDFAGLTLVAALGLPGFMHEDDPARAVRVALAVRRELRDLGFSCAVGVTTGRVFCGFIGSPRRRSYSMVGNAVNRCARLMRQADDDIFCDAATAFAAQRQVQFAFVRATELRGITGPVEIHRPLGEQAAPSPQADGFFGRIVERAAIHAGLAKFRDDGNGGVMIIEGEAGIGKSALLAELKKIAAELQIRLLSGGGDSIERTSSYRAWHCVFCVALDLPSEGDAAERSDLLLERLESDPETLRIAPLLNPVLNLHLPENEITSQMTAQSRAEATTEMLGRILRRAAGNAPLTVTLEDCHWLDSASLALAVDLQRSVPQMLLVALTRPLETPISEAWRTLRAAADGGHMLLGPLGPVEIRALVCRRLGVTAMPPAAADLIIEKAEGHPFFSEELGYALRDGGHLKIEDGICRLAPGGGDLRQFNFPSTVQGVVSARIDCLAPRERLALKVASVMGREFSLGTLRAIHPIAADHSHLGECLERLVAVDLTMRIADGEPVFEFKHAIVQEVAYEQLIFSQRRLLHRELAAWLESKDGGNFPLLAHHWSRAEVAGKSRPLPRSRG